MTSPLNMGNNKIINVKNATNNLDVVNLQQFNEGISAVANTVSKSYLKKDGTTLLTGNINLNYHKVVNMAIPIDKNDSANKSYVHQKIGDNHISCSVMAFGVICFPGFTIICQTVHKESLLEVIHQNGWRCPLVSLKGVY